MSAAALLGAVHADGIVSSDIVGYNTDSLTSGNFNMGGIMFSKVTGDAIDLNSDVTVANVTGGLDETESDTILVWNPSTSAYTTFYYNDDPEAPEDTGWWDVNFVVDPELGIGTAFWLRAKNAANKSITVSGAVESDDDFSVLLTGGNFNMVINPYPTAIDLNDTDTVEIANVTGGLDETESDTILVWNPSTSAYTTFYYNDDPEAPEDTGWWDVNFVVDPELSAGTAFWYRAKAGTGKGLTFKKTY